MKMHRSLNLPGCAQVRRTPIFPGGIAVILAFVQVLVACTRSEAAVAKPAAEPAPLSEAAAAKPVPLVDEANPGPSTSKGQVFASPDSAVPSVAGHDVGCGTDEDYYDSDFCLPGNCCSPWLHHQLYFKADYLVWWTQGMAVPPLVTTSTDTTNQAGLGVLGQPDTQVLFGGPHMNSGADSGARLSLGYWLSPCCDLALEASYLTLGRQSTPFDRASNNSGDPLLARPFYNVQPTELDQNRAPRQDSSILSTNGIPTGQIATGHVHAEVASEFHLFDVLIRRPIFLMPDCHIDFLTGYRFANLDDRVLVSDATNVADLSLAISSSDRFHTQNQFNGAVIGFATERRVCRWTLGTSLKLALGNTHSLTEIAGQTIQNNGTPMAGGLLALSTNSGPHDDNRFSMLPELGVTLGYNLTRQFRMNFGYSMMYWSSVARAGDQIDVNVNPNLLPAPASTRPVPSQYLTPPRPEFNLKTTDYWAQGMNVGIEYVF